MGILEDVTDLLNGSILTTLQAVETSIAVIDGKVAEIIVAIAALQANQTDPEALANLEAAAGAISDETASLATAATQAQTDITSVLPVPTP